MNRCYRGSVPLLVALVLTLGATACGRTQSEGGEGGSETTAGGPPSATENQIKPLPRDQVQDGGRLTWPIDSMPVTFNYNHIDGTDGRAHVLEDGVNAEHLPRGCGWGTDLEPGLPGVRAHLDHRTQTGRNLPHQSEGDLVRRYADHVGRLPLAVAGAEWLESCLPDCFVQRLLGDRERRPRPRRSRGGGHLQDQVRGLAEPVRSLLPCLDQPVAADLQ